MLNRVARHLFSVILRIGMIAALPALLGATDYYQLPNTPTSSELTAISTAPRRWPS
jgi:hypothetical protein